MKPQNFKFCNDHYLLLIKEFFLFGMLPCFFVDSFLVVLLILEINVVVLLLSLNKRLFVLILVIAAIEACLGFTLLISSRNGSASIFS